MVKIERDSIMQDIYDLWQAKQTLDLNKVSKIEFRYA
jgi:hypothetical protein